MEREPKHTSAQGEPMPVLSYLAPSNEAVVLSERAWSSLDRTRPSMNFLATLILIAGVAMVGGGFVEISLALTEGSNRTLDLALAVILGAAFMAFALFWILAALKLYRCAATIKAALANRRMADLETALELQAGFWRMVAKVWVGFILGCTAFALAIALVVAGK